MTVVHTIMKGVFSSYAKEQFREERWLAMVDSRSSRRELDEYNAVADMEVLEDIILAYDVWIIHRLYLEFEPLIKTAKSRGVKVLVGVAESSVDGPPNHDGRLVATCKLHAWEGTGCSVRASRTLHAHSECP